MRGQSGSPGGNRLRALRERAGKTQLSVELDAGLGSGYLQRVEAGKVVSPERETLERILAALEAGYSERRQVLELFGYVVKSLPPGETEIKWALGICQNELKSATFPAYLLDCTHSLRVYNAYFPRLLGGNSKSPAVTRLLGVSMLEAWFDPGYGLAPMLENPVEFYKGQIQALKYEMQLFWNEEWTHRIIEGLRERVPLFREYWDMARVAVGYAVAARPLVITGLNIPGVGRLYFRILSETFIQDNRFRIIYYLPADAATIQQCALWASENGG